MRAFLPLLLALSVVGAAQAQTVIINRPPIGSVPAQHQRVTVIVTLATPAAAGATSGDITGGLGAANTSLFGIVNHQYDVLGAQLTGRPVVSQAVGKIATPPDCACAGSPQP
jgi:hypothetical protein